MIIENANGNVYDVLSRMEAGSDNVYLLSDYGRKTVEEIQAGATPVQYIVARGWSEKNKCWDNGKYFSNLFTLDPGTSLADAKSYFLDTVERIFYSL